MNTTETKSIDVRHGERIAIGSIAILPNNPNSMRADQYEALLLAILAADGHQDPSAVLAAVRKSGAAGYPEERKRPPELLQPLTVAHRPAGWQGEDDVQYVLIDGEHRLRAAKELACDYVHAVMVNGFSIADVIAARIGLNHLRGELSYAVTADELRAIASMNNDTLDELYRAVVGYSSRELDVLLSATANAPVEILGAADEHERPEPEQPAREAAPTLTIKFATKDDRRVVQAWLKSMSDDPGAALLALAEKAKPSRGGKKTKQKT